MTTTHQNRSGAGRSNHGRSPHRQLWSDRFVGRERELESVAVGLQAAADARPTTLVLSGTAGIGLSCLLAETRRRIGARSFIAAGAVVTKDIPPRSFAKGAPARYEPLPASLDRANDRELTIQPLDIWHPRTPSLDGFEWPEDWGQKFQDA